jgi:hypothetical protein
MSYLHGTSTRKVDDLVKALGADTGISKSEVSRICKDLDTEVAAFRDRPLSEQRFLYVFLDATYCKARVNHRVVSQAVVIATGVAADGRREVLGFQVGDSEDGAFWTAFLRSLKSRGLAGVQLVISDAHAGLRAAIDAILIGAAWQRSSVNIRGGGMFPPGYLPGQDYTAGECDHADGPGSVEVRQECIGRVGPTRAPIAESQAEKASTRQRGYRAYRVLAAQRPRWRSWRFARGCRVWVRIPIPVRNERGREQYWH